MSKRLTKRIWQWHSWLGLVAGMGLILIGLTGSLLVFHDEIDAWRLPHLYQTKQRTAARLPYDVLWASVRAALPNERITGWTPAMEPGRTDGIYMTPLGEEEPRMVRINPYTGAVHGTPTGVEHTLFGWVLELHYAFLAGSVGIFVAGLLAVGLLALGLSGVWLYRGFWRNFFTLRWGRSARIFFSDVHKMVGISSVAFNLILGFTGAWWNLNAVYNQWTSKNAAPPAMPPPPAVLASFGGNGGLSLDALVARAQKELPGYRVTYIALSPESTGSMTFYGTVPTANPLRGDYGSRLTFDTPSGELINVFDVRKANPWEKFLDAFALLHFGTFGAAFGPVAALVVKILWTILGLSPGVLAVSGFVIWRARQHHRPAAIVPPGRGAAASGLPQASVQVEAPVLR